MMSSGPRPLPPASQYLHQRVADEAGDSNRRADHLRPPDRLGDGLCRIMDVGLIEKADFLVEGLEAGIRRSSRARSRACRRSSGPAPRAAPPPSLDRSPAVSSATGLAAATSMAICRPALSFTPIASRSSATMTNWPSPSATTVHVMADRAFSNFGACARRSVMFSANGGDGVGDHLAEPCHHPESARRALSHRHRHVVERHHCGTARTTTWK